MQIEALAGFVNHGRTAPPGQPPPLAGEKAEDYLNRRVEVLEARAEAENDRLTRDIRFAEAALATEPIAFERGRAIARRIHDEDLPRQISDLLAYRAALHHIGKGDLQTARSILEKSGDAIQKSAALVVGAQRLVGKEDFALASEWLAEAQRLIARGPINQPVEAGIGFAIVAVWAKFDRIAAHSALNNLVSRLSERVAVPVTEAGAPAAARIAGLTYSDFTHGTSGFGLGAAIDAFTPEDFDTLLFTLRAIKNLETRGAALVALCQRYLK